ncbi:hypothetical protein Ancab_012482, partial [Ancistrocladus abbreviatus]
MKGLVPLRESKSKMPASRATLKGPILPRKSKCEDAKRIWVLGKELGVIFAGEDSK